MAQGAVDSPILYGELRFGAWPVPSSGLWGSSTTPWGAIDISRSHAKQPLKFRDTSDGLGFSDRRRLAVARTSLRARTRLSDPSAFASMDKMSAPAWSAADRVVAHFHRALVRRAGRSRSSWTTLCWSAPSSSDAAESLLVHSFLGSISSGPACRIASVTLTLVSALPPRRCMTVQTGRGFHFPLRGFVFTTS